MRQIDVMQKYDLGKSTVNTICKIRKKSVLSGICGSSTKKRRQRNFENLEKALVLWIKQVSS